jgi:3-hydroxybutyryl-CoA dehydrogenase
MKKVAVIGAGTMGNGIAHTFAQHDFTVHLIDLSADTLKRGLETIDRNLGRQLDKGQIDADKKSQTLANISTFTSLKEGVKGIDLVVEAATENQGLKLKIFEDLDQFCDSKTILASNTSSIPITQLAGVTQRPDKVIGMHFMNPVPVMVLVEIIRGYNTSDEVASTIKSVAAQLGKTPVVVNDYPGFIANRILMPMINEAIESLHHGVADVMAIDTVMKLGMAHPMGPLQLADCIGLDICLSILNVMHDGFKNPKYAACPLLVNMVRAGKLGVKSGEGFYDYSTTRKAEVVASQFSK